MKQLARSMTMAAILVVLTVIAVYAVETQNTKESATTVINIMAAGKTVAVVRFPSKANVTLQSDSMDYDKARSATQIKGNARIQVPLKEGMLEVSTQEAEVIQQK